MTYIYAQWNRFGGTQKISTIISYIDLSISCKNVVRLRIQTSSQQSTCILKYVYYCVYDITAKYAYIYCKSVAKQ